MLNARRVKDLIVCNNKVFKIFIFLVNIPLIGHIYDAIYLKVARKKIENSDLNLIIEPNNICNLRCVMCPYSKMKRKKETMSMDLFKSIIDQASEMGCKSIQLQQFNEPFLDKLIFDRIKYVRRKDKNIEINTYSNGTIVDKDIRKKILDTPLDRIRFSFDGATKKTFESIRVGANFEKVVENIQSLVKERNERGQKLPVIEVYFTILDSNKKEIKDFLKFWKGKCDYASLYPADSRQSGDFPPIKYKNKKPYPCYNPKLPVILSNGKVVLCCIDYDGEVVLGDVKKEKLKDIINSKKARGIFESQMNRTCDVRMCKDCSKLYIDSAFQWWI